MRLDDPFDCRIRRQEHRRSHIFTLTRPNKQPRLSAQIMLHPTPNPHPPSRASRASPVPCSSTPSVARSRAPDVYPLMCRLLAAPCHAHNGSLAATNPLVRAPASAGQAADGYVHKYDPAQCFTGAVFGHPWTDPGETFVRKLLCRNCVLQKPFIPRQGIPFSHEATNANPAIRQPTTMARRAQMLFYKTPSQTTTHLLAD